MLTLPTNAQWSENGKTVAGGNGDGNALNQLDCPLGLDIDDDNQCIVIADWGNHRIMEWKEGVSPKKVIPGGQGWRKKEIQLNHPTDVLFDQEKISFFIADGGNRRVIRCVRDGQKTLGGPIVDNISCRGLAIDQQGYLYVSDTGKNEVRRYTIGDTNGIVVAGGNGQGDQFNQLNYPTYLFVDKEQAVYVSDEKNHRVMKWNEGANQGTVVAGGREGNDRNQLRYPKGLFVDTLGTIYVVDSGNNRVMRWQEGAQTGTVIAGRNQEGSAANQLYKPSGLSFDCHGNLYVADNNNSRVQRFDRQ